MTIKRLQKTLTKKKSLMKFQKPENKGRDLAFIKKELKTEKKLLL